MNTARPLGPGEHMVGATLGGPLIELGGPLPLPNLVIEGRSGLSPVLNRPMDVNYGMNLTGTVFGLVGLHGGVAWQVVPPAQARPAISVSFRQYLYTNALDGRKVGRGLGAVEQLETTASWEVGANQRWLLYGGAAEYVSVPSAGWLFTPFVGAQVGLGRAQRWSLQLEARHFGINQTPLESGIPWLTWGPGALGGTVGVIHRVSR